MNQPFSFPSESSCTQVQLRVRLCETDLMGIVHHSQYLAYCEAARVEWLRRRGALYADWAAQGIHLPVVQMHVRYRHPARFDDVLDVETTLVNLRAASVRFDYRILRKATVLCEAWTWLAYVDDTLTVRRFNEKMRKVFCAPEQTLEKTD